MRAYALMWRRVLGALALAACVVGIALYLAYPRTTLVMGIGNGFPELLKTFTDAEKANSPYHAFAESLAKNGITLQFRDQRDGSREKPMLQWLMEAPQEDWLMRQLGGEPRVDWVLATNTGVKLDPALKGKFTSMGVVSSVPMFFYVRAGDQRIKKAGDLRGKKILFSSLFKGAAGADGSASRYSADHLRERFFEVLEITGSNSTLIDVQEGEWSTQLDWDVAVSFGNQVKGLPLWDELNAGKVEYLRLDDLEGVRRRLPELKPGVFRASSLIPANGIPRQDIPYLAYTTSAVARSNLDPSLAIALAEALKAHYSIQTLIRNKDEYPTFSQSEMFEPNPTARDFYVHGRPWLSQYLSPTLASFLFKLLVVLVPVLAVVSPLLGHARAAYQFYVTHAVTQSTLDLERIEKAYAAADGAARESLRRELGEIQANLQELRMPLFHRYFASQVFSARGHADSVHRKIQALEAAPRASPPDGRPAEGATASDLKVLPDPRQ